MAECFNRQMLRDLLNNWQSGAIDDVALSREATELWNKYGVWINAPETDARSITKTALEGMLLRTEPRYSTGDVPAVLDFLNTPMGEEAAGWERWRAYWSGAERASG
ncbi:MAG: hypothetical protein M5R36_26335 [Deltaproteobacteria bacterium]|nr:hypothetical protein [Deltaproteobacteria bacterium]